MFAYMYTPENCESRGSNLILSVQEAIKPVDRHGYINNSA